MNVRISFLISLISGWILGFSSFAQDTVYVNSQNDTVKRLEDCNKFYVTKIKITEDSVKQVDVYLSNGNISKHQEYIIINGHEKEHGVQKVWYKNGKLKSSMNFVDGKLNGFRETYWQNGTIKRQDSLLAGELRNGICYDSLGNEIDYFDYLILPQYPGGESAMFKQLGEELRYPATARDAGIMGIVYITFVVSPEGKIKDISVLRGIGGGCDQECLRFVGLMPDWTPGKIDGEPAAIQYNLPIRFVLSTGGSKKSKKKKSRKRK